MLAAALEAKVEHYIEAHADARDAAGRRLVVRNGRAQSRTVTCGAGTLQVRAPRVNDRRVGDEGARQRFTQSYPAPVYASFAAGGRGLASAVSARLVDGRLPGSAAGAAGRGRGGLECDEHLAADGGLGRGVPSVPAPEPVGVRLHLRVGGRDPLQPPPGRRPAVHAGDARGAVGRHEGAGGHRGRLSGECGELVERAAGPAPARPSGAGDGGRPTVRSASGRRYATVLAGDDARNATGVTSWPTCSTSCPKRLRPRAKRALQRGHVLRRRGADAETANRCLR